MTPQASAAVEKALEELDDQDVCMEIDLMRARRVLEGLIEAICEECAVAVLCTSAAAPSEIWDAALTAAAESIRALAQGGDREEGT